MRLFLGALVVLFNLADNATTFLCLRAPVPGFEVIEANPAAACLFDAIGLERGLVLEMVVTTVAIALTRTTADFMNSPGRCPRTRRDIGKISGSGPCRPTPGGGGILHALPRRSLAKAV